MRHRLGPLAGAVNARGGATERSPLWKSLQVISLSPNANTVTQTITAVDLSQTILLWQGHSIPADGTAAARETGRLTMTNATTVSATSVVVSCTIAAIALEFWPGLIKSIQSGTIATDSTSTATIIAVDPLRSFVLFLGSSGTVGNAVPVNQSTTKLALTNATTVTCVVGATGAGLTTGFMVVERF